MTKQGNVWEESGANERTSIMEASSVHLKHLSASDMRQEMPIWLPRAIPNLAKREWVVVRPLFIIAIILNLNFLTTWFHKFFWKNHLFTSKVKTKMEILKFLLKIRQNEGSYVLCSLTVNNVSRIFFRIFITSKIRQSYQKVKCNKNGSKWRLCYGSRADHHQE